MRMENVKTACRFSDLAGAIWRRHLSLGEDIPLRDACATFARFLATFARRFSADSAPPACRALHIDMTGRRRRHICGVVWFCRAQRRKAGGAPARAGRA